MSSAQESKIQYGNTVTVFPGELVEVVGVVEELPEASDGPAPLHQLGVQLQGSQQQALPYLWTKSL